MKVGIVGCGFVRDDRGRSGTVGGRSGTVVH